MILATQKMSRMMLCFIASLLILFTFLYAHEAFAANSAVFDANGTNSTLRITIDNDPDLPVGLKIENGADLLFDTDVAIVGDSWDPLGTGTTYNVTFGPSVSSGVDIDNRKITIKSNAGDVIYFTLTQDPGGADTEIPVTGTPYTVQPNNIPGGGSPDTGEKSGLGEACGTLATSCKNEPGFNLVCAPVEIGRKHMCRGLLDQIGCSDVFNNMAPEDKTAFGVKSIDDLCGTGLICSTIITPSGVCVNDFGGRKAAELKLGEDTTDIRTEINRVINVFLSFLAIVGIILIIYGGILWATASGNEEQTAKARKTIIAAVIGLIIIGIAWTIVSYVINLGDTIS